MFTAYSGKPVRDTCQCLVGQGCQAVSLGPHSPHFGFAPLQVVAERQQEYREKLQGICDLLTQTENRLIGHQEAFVIGDGTADLKKYQSRQEVEYALHQGLVGRVTLGSITGLWKALGSWKLARSYFSEARRT